MLKFRIARKEDLAEVEEIYTQSFMNYDFYKVVEADEKKREVFIRALQHIEIATNFKRGQLFVGEDEGQVVMAMSVHFPGVEQPDLLDYLLNGGVGAILGSGPDTLMSWYEMYQECEKPLKDIEEPMFYLEQLAIKSGIQGKGYGGQALQNGLIPLVEAYGGGTIAFITNSQSNVRFYTHNGFECFYEGECSYKGTKLGNWCFRREVVVD